MQTLLGIPIFDFVRDRYRLGVYVDFELGKLYLEPALGRIPIRAQDLPEASSKQWKARVDFIYFKSYPIRDVLQFPPDGRWFYRFRIDPKHGRLVVGYTEEPTRDLCRLSLRDRRKLYIRT